MAISVELLDLLKSREGVIEFGKRPKLSNLPEVSVGVINLIFGSKRQEFAAIRIQSLLDYCQKPALADSFGADHVGRKKWRRSMLQEFGNEFHGLMIVNNQFTTSAMAVVINSYQLLERYAEQNNEFIESSKFIHSESVIENRRRGYEIHPKRKVSESYDRLVSPESKLVVVHVFEDRILSDLELLSQIPY
jgi:hypothetical protein